VTAGTEALGLEFAHVRSGLNWPLLLAGVALVISILISTSLFLNGKRGWGWVAVGGAIVAFLYLLHTLDRLNNIHIGDYGTLGGDGGGFGGGFGGGSSGGGGASGGW
jgi:uncharacterized protein